MKNIMKISTVFLCAALLAYSCDNGSQTEEPVEPIVPEVDPPVVEVANGGQIVFPAEGGQGSLEFSIVNPVEGADISVEIPEGNDWIEASISGESVSLTVLESKEDDNRAETLTINYAYGEECVEAYINVLQEAPVFDYRIDAKTAVCTWYDNVYSNDPNLINYNIVLRTDDGVLASLDLFAPENTDDMLAPAEKYIAYEYGMEEGYSLAVGELSYTYLYKLVEGGQNYEYDVLPTLGSEVEVIRDGDVFTIRAVLIAGETGQSFLIRYTGELEADNGLIGSTLDGDVNKVYDAAELGLVANASCFDNTSFGYSSNSWFLVIANEDYNYVLGAPVIYMELYTDTDVDTPEQLLGTYVADPDYYINMAPGTFALGGAGYTGTWYMEIGEVTSSSAFPSDEAPIRGGSVEFVLNGNGTFNLILDGVDDNYEEPHRVYVVMENLRFNFQKTTSFSSIDKIHLKNNIKTK